MKASDLLDVATVERLALKPGDILVFKYPNRLTAAEFEYVSARFKELLPDTKVLVFEDGADVAVLRAET